VAGYILFAVCAAVAAALLAVWFVLRVRRAKATRGGRRW
jgi:hypothetical protein